jgi:hypothetical protein
MKILVQFPTRGRPAKAMQTLGQYMRLQATGLVDYHVVADRDDKTMEGAVRLALWNMRVHVSIAPPAGKIAACNDVLLTDWDIVVLASDDMIPQIHGWDARIIEDMARHFPDTDGVLHYNDGTTRASLCTLSILGRRYYERDGYIYHPSYKSLWCDNEFTDVARARGKYVYIPQCIIRHEHPGNGFGGMDDVYRVNNRHNDADQANYERRKAAGWPKE